MNFFKRLIVIICCFVVIAYSLFSIFKIITTIAPDFVVYYSAAKHIQEGISPYTTTSFTLFAYPPISAIFYSPVTLLPYQIAQGMFVLLSFSCTFLCVSLCLRLLNKKASILAYMGIVAFFLLSFPTKFTLGMGQSNLVALTCILAAVWLDRKNRYVGAGLLLALGIIFKPILLLSIVYFALSKSWKTISLCTLTGSFLAILQLSLFHSTFLFWQEYLTHVLPHLFTTVGREVYYNQGLLGTLSRLTPNFQMRSIFTLLGSLSIVLSILWYIWKYNIGKNTILALFLCMIPLIDGLSWQHHFVVLLFPFLYVLYLLKDSRFGLLLLTISYILVSINISTPTHITSFPQNILLSHTFWGTLLLLCLIFFTTSHTYELTLQR